MIVCDVGSSTDFVTPLVTTRQLRDYEGWEYVLWGDEEAAQHATRQIAFVGGRSILSTCSEYTSGNSERWSANTDRSIEMNE